MGTQIKRSRSLDLDKRSSALWYAAYTRSRYEKKVAEQLHERSIKYYLPLIPTLRQWKDRKKMVKMPLFPGYLFVCVALAQSVSVLSAKGVVRLIGFNDGPAPIPESQIENIRRLLSKPERIEPVSYINEGECVEIIVGPCTGIRGRLLERHGQRRLLVGIDLIQQAISVEVDLNWVRPVTNCGG